MNDNLKLDDVCFIGGGNQTLVFEVFDRNGEPLDLGTSTVKWTLCNIGQKESPIITKDNKAVGGITTSKHTFSVELSASDTIYLYDMKYEQEPIIIQSNGKVIRPNYGFIEVRKGSEY